ncbi:hypothetical protein U1437_00615, partial [Aeromonas caviae]
GMLLSDRHGCYYVIGMNVIERSPCVGICNESVEQMQTDLDSYLDHYNTQRPHQGRMMEGQTPYSMFKKGLKLIPKEVRTKVA